MVSYELNANAPELIILKIGEQTFNSDLVSIEMNQIKKKKAVPCLQETYNKINWNNFSFTSNDVYSNSKLMKLEISPYKDCQYSLTKGGKVCKDCNKEIEEILLFSLAKDEEPLKIYSSGFKTNSKF